MENKKHFKKLIKHYLDLRKMNEDVYNISNIIEKVYKVMDYVHKLSNNEELTINSAINSVDYQTSVFESLEKDNFNYDYDSKNILCFIKKYCFILLSKIFDNNLALKNKTIGHEIFIPVEEGDLDGISISESYNDFKIYNENGSTPLHVCIKNGDTTILKKFLKNGESIDLNDKNGHSLLEYACELKDPNLITFLISHGSNPKKHLFFRENNKDCKMLTNDIDLANLIKVCLQIGALSNDKILPKFAREKLYYNVNNNSCVESEKSEYYSNILKTLCFSKISNDYFVGLGNLKFSNFYEFLSNTILNLDEDDFNTYYNIIDEEFNYSIINKLGCPTNYFEILIINLVPFIKYDFNISTKFIVVNELVYTVRLMFENNNLKLNNKFYNNLLNKIWLDYKDILPIDFIGINLSSIFSKIKNIL